MNSIRLSLAVVATLVLTACASGGAVSGTTASASTNASGPVAGAIDATTAPFVGSKKSKKFYPSSCQTVKLIKTDEQVGFASIRDAEKAGFAKDLFSADCRY